MNKTKDWLKLIGCLSRILMELHSQQHVKHFNLLNDFGQQCMIFPQDARRYSKAIQQSWFYAAEHIRERVRLNLADFTFKVEQFKENFVPEKSLPPSFSMLFAELSQIEQEFGPLNYNLEEQTLSVVTDPVVLDEIYLGSFQIQLRLKEIPRLHEISPYRVIALNPHPAGSDENVTHPHVTQECLCEGDGYVPIRKALREGRLCDFFMMVTAILNTYNPGSAYVDLDDWEGTACYDCGYRISPDERYFCENCENDFCDSCSSYCKICDRIFCRGCLSECPDCEEPVCQDCFSACGDCHRVVCTDCLKDGLCYDCTENRKDQEDEKTTQQTGPAVQPNSVGQAHLSA